MNKTCFLVYASSFCTVKLLSAGLTAVIISFYDSVRSTDWLCFPFCVWHCSLVEYSIKQSSAVSISPNLLLLIYRLCQSNWILHVSVLCAKHWFTCSGLSIMTGLVVSRTWLLTGKSMLWQFVHGISAIKVLIAQKILILALVLISSVLQRRSCRT